MLRLLIELDEVRACVVGFGLAGASERRSGPVDDAELPERLREAATEVGGGLIHGEVISAEVARSGVTGVLCSQRSVASYGEAGSGAD